MSRAPTVTATLDGADADEARAELDELRPVLIVAWADQEPERVGELLFVDRHASFFGRDSEAAEVRALLVRQRPGVNEATAPLSNPFLSRRHLKLRLLDEDCISIECLGKRPLLVKGRELQEAVVRPGELVELRGLYSFSCALRPRRLRGDAALHDFGEPDANGIVGESVACWQLRRQIAFASARAAHVLIMGPSGTGKELV